MVELSQTKLKAAQASAQTLEEAGKHPLQSSLGVVPSTSVLQQTPH